MILATGGMAALWQRTTNPRGAVGSGLSLASAAGAELADLEFMQFHPTALRLDGPRDGFLVTEAVRGEGALLFDHQGERFVDELAPRDEVALAIHTELERTGEPAVWLDMRAVDVERFPNIAAALAEVGPRPEARPAPRGARRALHDGRNRHRPRRALVAGRAVRGRRVRLHRPARREPAGLELARRVPRVRAPRGAGGDRRAGLAAPRRSPWSPRRRPKPGEDTRAALWRHAGLRRDAAGLAELLEDPYPLARLIGAACLAREESRGAHQRSDHPDTDRGARPDAYARGGRRRTEVRAMAVTTHTLFREAMTHLASGVAVITARRPDGAPCGIAATSLTSYSAHPPSLLVSVWHESRCHDALAASERFGVHLLKSDEVALAQRFANRELEDKFDGLDWHWDDDVPELAGTLAYLRCAARRELREVRPHRS